jgi:hypothetical protein
LLAGAEPEVAQGSIDRIRTNLEIHNSTPGKLLIRLSLGYATAVAPGGLSEASRQADTVMYQEKFQMRAQRVQDILKSMRYDF